MAGDAQVGGWTPARQEAFLEALRDTGCVRSACRHVGLAASGAQAVRRRSPAFAAAWDNALALRLPMLERAAFDRAVTGWSEPVLHGGKVVAERRRFSDTLLRLLIARAERDAEQRAVRLARLRREDTDATLRRLLDRRAAALRREATAEADRLREAGEAP